MENKKFPKKNIDPVLIDVRHPRGERGRDELPDLKIGPGKFSKLLKRTFLLSLIALVLGGIFLGFQVVNLKSDVEKSVSGILDSFREISRQFKNLETQNVASSLTNVSSQVESLDSQFRFLKVIPILKEIPEAFQKLQALTQSLLAVNAGISNLEENGLKMVLGDEGDLITTLKDIKTNLDSLDTIGRDLRNKASKLGALPADFDANYLSLTTELSKARDGVASLVGLLDSSEEKHLLVIFENPSEIRPGGGFVGSYADVTFAGGKIRKIDVNDIYYPDKFLKAKFVPPLELQALTIDWGARDANWFFDFPVSAERIIQFLEASPVYGNAKIKFAGVVALNIRVVEDLLKATGPIEVKEYKLVLNDLNFLKQVQYEVEAGRDKKPGANPKKILSVITPILTERLKSLNESDRKDILHAFGYRLSNKDIKVFMRDVSLQKFASQYGASGEVMSLPYRFSGDYLAVVNANVSGGKSDAFMKQSIFLSSSIGDDGTVTDNLVVKRAHKGAKEKESWYRAVNQNFIKIFTHPDSHLEALSGNTPKKISPRLNYDKAGYLRDINLKAIEDTREGLEKYGAETFKESGRKVFATWFNVAAGKTGELNLSYSGQARVNVAEDTKYQFIFEKQSGVESNFQYNLEAPNGFTFEETKSQIFHYETDELPSRLIINLTLKKNGS